MKQVEVLGELPGMSASAGNGEIPPKKAEGTDPVCLPAWQGGLRRRIGQPGPGAPLDGNVPATHPRVWPPAPYHLPAHLGNLEAFNLLRPTSPNLENQHAKEAAPSGGKLQVGGAGGGSTLAGPRAGVGVTRVTARCVMGRGKRNLRNKRTRKRSSCRRFAGLVGKAMRRAGPPGPPWERSKARDANLSVFN